MKYLIVFISVFSVYTANAEGWDVPETGIMDYSQGQAEMPTFNVPQPATVNYPMPQWSTDIQTPGPEPIIGIQNYGQ